MKVSLKRNYIYNLSYTIFNLIVPILLLPYLTRILGKENIGLNSFSFSITQYFIFLGTLGILTYGTREIAYVKNDFQKMNNTFFDLLIVKIISSVFSYILFLIFIRYQNKELQIYLYLYSLHLIGVLLDTTWLFQGLEDFKKISIRNFFIKCLTIILVFTLVTSKEDLWIYILILSMSNIISQLVMVKYILQIFDYKKYIFNSKRVYKHFKSNLKLFILQIAIQIYAYVDKIMLGYYGQIIQVGYYDIAQQIVRVGIVINGTLASVMMPRISNLFSQNKILEIKQNIENSLIFSLSLSYPLIFGILATRKEFVLLFLGEDYIEVSSILLYLLPILFIIPIGNVLGIQLMIPLKKENLVTICPIIGAILNVSFNFYLIPKYSILGAAMGTIIAESSGSLITLYIARKWVNISNFLLKTYKSFFSSIIMYVIIMKFSLLFKENLLVLLISKILFGGIVYLILMYLFKEKFIIENINRLKYKKGD